MFDPGATTVGLSSSHSLSSPSSSLGPELEYDAIMSSPRSIVFSSSIAPTVMALSDAPTEVTLRLPSLPMAATGTIPASAAASTALASALVPLSPGSSSAPGLAEPKDIVITCMPSLDSLLPQSVSTLSTTHWIPRRVAAELVAPASDITLTSTR